MVDRYKSTFTTYQNTIVPRTSQAISMETTIRNINLSLICATKATYHRRNYGIHLEGLQVIRSFENIITHCSYIFWNLKILHIWKIREGIISYIPNHLWQTDAYKLFLTITIIIPIMIVTRFNTNHSISLTIFSDGRRYHQSGNISTLVKSCELSQTIGIIQIITQFIYGIDVIGIKCPIFHSYLTRMLNGKTSLQGIISIPIICTL